MTKTTNEQWEYLFEIIQKVKQNILKRDSKYLLSGRESA